MKFLPKITIYDKYIFKQVLITSFVAILLFTVVWIAPEMLLNTIKKTLEGAFGVKTAILILLYEMPNILGKAFPVGLLLGTLFTFDKLSKDSELTIFRAVGMSFSRIIAPVIVLSLIVTWFCFLTVDRLIPLAEFKSDALGGGYITTQYIYTQKNEQNIPTKAVVISRFSKDTMYNVIVLDFSKKEYNDVHQLRDIYVAKTGKTYSDKWVLNDIVQYRISSDGIFEKIDKIPTMNILEGESANNAYTLMTYSVKKEREITNKDLKNYVKLLKKEGLDEEYRYMLNKYLQRFFTHLFACCWQLWVHC